jgi:predicted TIM-barrel fold metal-dependent hydrolase
MFGGDWPVCTQSVTLAAWVAALTEAVADRPIECRNGLFFDNAVRVYGLEDA